MRLFTVWLCAVRAAAVLRMFFSAERMLAIKGAGKGRRNGTLPLPYQTRIARGRTGPQAASQPRKSPAPSPWCPTATSSHAHARRLATRGPCPPPSRLWRFPGAARGAR